VLSLSAETDFSEPVKPDADNAVVGNFSNEIKQFIADLRQRFPLAYFIFRETVL
jgi:hypothetical protein